MRHLFCIVFLTCCLTSLSIELAYSDSSNSRRPDTDEIIKGLKLKSPAKQKSLDRGWVGSNRGVTAEAEESLPETSSIDLEVNFEYNSTQLTTDAQLNLKRLGLALNSAELSSQRFKITGHTDAVGGENYNRALSERRALSVRDYLVKKNRIDAGRLEVEGKGYSELADPQNPASAVNRRVQVTNLGT